MSCFIDQYQCAQFLPLSGRPENCVRCQHSQDVHAKILDNDDSQILPNQHSTGMYHLVCFYILTYLYYYYNIIRILNSIFLIGFHTGTGPIVLNISSSISIPTTSSSQLPASRQYISDQVRTYRQRVDPTNDIPEQLSFSSRYNTISLPVSTPSSFTTSKIYTKQLSLFFHKKGTSTPIRYGSPMVKHYNKSDRIADWQQYLYDEVITHPAWRSYPKIKDFEINPHIPICVGYWEGGNIQPAANKLLGTGTVADLLRLVKNPKIANTARKSVAVGKGGKSVSEPIKMAYTIHIRYCDDSSSSDNKSGSLSDIGDDLKETHLVTRRKKSPSVSPAKCSHLSASTLSRRHSSNRKPISTSAKSSSTTTKPTQYSDTEE